MEDYDDVIALWEETVLPYKPRGRDARERISREIEQPNCIFLVAEMDGRVVGTVLGTHDGRKGWINRLAVLPEYQRKGIGKTLVEEVERRLMDMGIEIIACLVEAWNTSSLKFFEQLGYMKHEDIIYHTKRKHPDV